MKPWGLLMLASLLGMTPAPATAQHAGHEHPVPPAAPAPVTPSDAPPPAPLVAVPAHTPVPPLTDADRAAAFPDVHGHAVHDRAINTYVLFDQLEWQSGGGGHGVRWDASGWIGRDRDRVWFRGEGTSSGGRVDDADVHVLYGRAISPWWTVVGGVRQDLRPVSAQTWAAVGVQGVAPYRLQVQATGYLGAGGRTQLRLKTEYELLVTNRLVLQQLIELEAFSKGDPERGIGPGLSSVDTGLRLRYEIRRELAPYIGVSWHRTFFGTADAARAAGEPTSTARFTLGVRLWN